MTAFTAQGSRRIAGRLLSALLICLTVPACASKKTDTKPPTIDPTYGMSSIPSERPAHNGRSAPDAKWIWADTTANNQTVFLRGAFTLRKTPRSASVYVTADDFFTLYVNGQQVDESKADAKDDLVWKHVHHPDITKYLSPGKNVVAIRGVNAGSAAGVVARVEVDGKPALLTDANWKESEAADLPPDWTAVNFDDSGWKQATVIGNIDADPWSGAGGLEGWPGYQAGSAAYLAHLPLRAVAVLDIHPGEGGLEGAETLAGAAPAALKVHSAPADSKDPPSLVLDFGKELSGRVEMEGTGTALVGTGESREEAIKSPWGGVHRLDLTPDRMAATPYSAFRYAKITFVGVPGTPTDGTVSNVTLDHDYYPVTYKGSFDCSDPLLTKIWYTGAYTAHLCMQQDIWDAPKRDRARWMGDLHVSGEVINNVFADRFLMEQTMQRLRDDAGAVGAAPHDHVNGIPGYSCAWIAGLADFHRHIGDYDYLNKQHDQLLSMLEYFRGELDDRGIFANKYGKWPFVDWAPDFNGDTPQARAATHLFLVKAVKEAVFLLKEMKDETNAARYAAWADELTAAAQKYLPDADTHTFGDRRQENAMAIYSGVATPEQTQIIYDTILKPGTPAWDIVATPYYNNYVIYAMSLAGHTAETEDFLRRYWGGMLAEGATSFWEGYDPKWEKDDFHAHLQADNGTGYFVSLCHGWSAGCTSWLTERALGVRPTGGGFQTAEIVPDLGNLDWAEGDVPTPNGLLHVRAERKGPVTTLHITLPKGVDAFVGVPGARATLNGRNTTGKTAEGRTYLSLNRPGKYTLTGAD